MPDERPPGVDRPEANSPRRARSGRAPVTVLLAGGGLERMVPALQAAAPGAELVVVPSAPAGEAYLDWAEAAIMADRVRPAYLTAPRLR